MHKFRGTLNNFDLLLFHLHVSVTEPEIMMETTLRIFFSLLKWSGRFVLSPVSSRKIPVSIRLLQHRSAVPGDGSSPEMLQRMCWELHLLLFPSPPNKNNYFPFKESCSASLSSLLLSASLQKKRMRPVLCHHFQLEENCSFSASQSTHTDFSGTTKLNIYFLIFISGYETC